MKFSRSISALFLFRFLLILNFIVFGFMPVLADPPDEPSFFYPSDQAVNVERAPVLEWLCGDPDGDNVSYVIFFGTNPNPPVACIHAVDLDNNDNTDLADASEVKAVDFHSSSRFARSITSLCDCL